MKVISIFNHVLGPVMRGPSSSHTAGAFHIGSMARSILGTTPKHAVLAFDPEGSYAPTYQPQGADRGFVMGLMNRPVTDESFFTALKDAPGAGMDLKFEVRPLEKADHPNTTDLMLANGAGTKLHLVARSIGGGEVEITSIDGRPVRFNGTAYETLVEIAAEQAGAARALLVADGGLLESPTTTREGSDVRMVARRKAPLQANFRAELRAPDSNAGVWESTPVYFVQKGKPLFSSAAEMVKIAEARGSSLGKVALGHVGVEVEAVEAFEFQDHMILLELGDGQGHIRGGVGWVFVPSV